MNIILRIIVFIIINSSILYTSYAYAENTDPDSLESIIEKIHTIVKDRNNEKILFVIQFEKVLIYPVDEAFYITDDNYKSLISRALAKVPENKLGYINEIILTEYKNRIKDTRLITLANEMIKNKIAVIITTNNVSGAFKKIPYLEEWTVRYLEQLGLKMKETKYAPVKLVLDMQYTKERGSFPTFYKSLLSCSYNKGNNSLQSVLSGLLTKLKQMPTTVIMIHNDETIFAVMKEQLKKVYTDMEFFGFHYTSIKETNEKIPTDQYIKFWQNIGKQLNSVTRDNKEEDISNPYEEEN